LGAPAVEGPGFADEGTQGDVRVGEAEVGVDDVFAAFVAALQAVEDVVPGVRALDVPAAAGLDRCFLALVGDLVVQAAFSAFIAVLPES
jgi:hypothetical protein